MVLRYHETVPPISLLEHPLVTLFDRNEAPTPLSINSKRRDEQPGCQQGDH